MKGTVSSKKKKEKKLQRVLAAVKKQKRKANHNHENFAAIQLLHDPQVIAAGAVHSCHAYIVMLSASHPK